MSEGNVISSLLSYCTTCEAKCCKDAFIIHTKAEYQRIADAGHDTSPFKEIIIPEGSFYLLYFKDASCPYLQANNTCGIEKVKSDTCRAYPGRAVYDRRDNSFSHTGFDKTCPAVAALCEQFKELADNLVQQHVEQAPYVLHRRIMAKYHDDMRAQNAQAAADKLKEQQEKRAVNRQEVIATMILNPRPL